MKTEKPKLEKHILIFYHGGCLDGFSAAWVAHKKFGDNAEYIPASHNEMYDIKGKEIYMLDISISDNEEDIKQLVNNNDVTLIDHHITRKSILPLIPKSYFDTEKSGCMLTWEYFNPGEKPPLLLRHVQAQDLWSWTLDNTREIMTVISTFEQTFENWDKAMSDIETESERNKYIEKGKIMMDYFNFLCDRIVEDGSALVEFEGHQVYAVNVPHMFASIVGNNLATRTNSFGICWVQDEENIRVSLRSVRDFDASMIAKKYGGGGHKNACGFRLPLGTVLPWKVIKEKD